MAVSLLYWSAAMAATGSSSSPPTSAQSTTEISAEDLRWHIARLAPKQMEGCVAEKWALVLRYLPEGIFPGQR